MAYPQVAAVKTATDTGTTHTVSYHTSGESTYSSGDLLILIIACDGSGSDIPSPPAGDWTTNKLFSENASDHGAMVSWKESDGTENGGTFNCTTPTSEGTAWFLIHITGWDTATAPEVGARAGDTSDDWLATSITPSGWDSSSEDTLWIAFCTNDGSSRVTSTYPTETPNDQQYSGDSGLSFPGVAMATDEERAATFSTTKVTGCRSSNADNNAGILAVRPSGGGGGGGGPKHLTLLGVG